MKRAVFFPALALLGACAMMGGGSKEEKKSGTVSAQDTATKQFQQAADAQKAAADEQAKAEQTDRDVEKAQKALADAQAKASGQHAKAQQAQVDARRLAQQSNAQGVESQQQATTVQKQEREQTQQQVSQRQSWVQEKSISGQVLEASGNQIRLRTPDRKDMALDLNDSTAVRIDGQLSQPSQIKPGDDVRASYQLVDGKAKALQIDVKSSRGSSGAGTTTDSPQK